MSGVRTAEQARAMYLCELALDLAGRVLLPGGDFLIKIFQGEGFDAYHKQVRETFESAVLFGAAALRALDVPEDEADAIAAQVRRLDAERFELEVASNDTRAGIPLIIKNTDAPGPKPTPLTRPRRESRVLNVDVDVPASTPDGAAPRES